VEVSCVVLPCTEVLWEGSAVARFVAEQFDGTARSSSCSTLSRVDAGRRRRRGGVCFSQTDAQLRSQCGSGCMVYLLLCCSRPGRGESPQLCPGRAICPMMLLAKGEEIGRADSLVPGFLGPLRTTGPGLLLRARGCWGYEWERHRVLLPGEDARIYGKEAKTAITKSR
jgi:hypothetical protein